MSACHGHLETWLSAFSNHAEVVQDARREDAGFRELWDRVHWWAPLGEPDRGPRLNRVALVLGVWHARDLHMLSITPAPFGWRMEARDARGDDGDAEVYEIGQVAYDAVLGLWPEELWHRRGGGAMGLLVRDDSRG